MGKYTLVDCSGKKAIYIKNVTWQRIVEELSAIRNGHYGALELETEYVHSDVGIHNLSLSMENGWYLITLLESTEEKADLVRSYYKPDPNYKMIEIGGNNWSSTQLIRDFDLVLQIFKEFYETGDVSKDILDFD